MNDDTRRPAATRVDASADDALLEAMVADALADEAAGTTVDAQAICQARPDLLPTLRQLLALAKGVVARPEPTADPLVGRLLGDRYRLTAPLGAGGMGMVYAARDEQLGREVAVKVLDDLFAADSQRVERFRREATSLAALDDPHIVAVHDFELTSRPPYLVMERVVGFDLAALIRALRDDTPPEQTPTPAQVSAAAATCTGLRAEELAEVFAKPWPQLVALFALQMTRALSVAHGVGVVHRDVKPSNFMADGAGRVRLLDFGLARRDVDVTMTRSDTRVGTPLYMAPEQVRGEEARPTSDIYSLGATLYELMCLQPPFLGQGSELEARILHHEPVPPQRRRGRLPRDLGAIALKALHKAPSRRYATAAAMADELERFLRFEPVLAQTRVLPAPLRTAVGWFRRYRSAALGVAAAVVVIGSLALVAGRMLGERHGRASADSRRAEVHRLSAGLSPYLAFAGGRDDRLQDPQRSAQLARLDEWLALEPGDVVARFLRLWTRGEEDPPPPCVASDRSALRTSLGEARLQRLYERVALPVQRRNRTDRRAGGEAMLAALAEFEAEPRPLDALGRRLCMTVTMQLAEFDRTQQQERADQLLQLARVDENEHGRTAFTCFARAIALQLLADPRGARDSLLACDDLCPEQPATLYSLARVYRLLGQPNRARPCMAAALVRMPAPHVNYLEQHALLLVALNDYEAAEGVLRRFPDDADSRVRAAMVRVRMALLQATLHVGDDPDPHAVAEARAALAALDAPELAGRLTQRQAQMVQAHKVDLATLETDDQAARVEVCRGLLRDPTTGRLDDPLNHWLLERLGQALTAAGDPSGELLQAIATSLERLEQDGVMVR